MVGTSLPHGDYRAAVAELDGLCQSEYGIGLVSLLQDRDQKPDLTLERLRRLTGILLKQPFAEPTEVEPGETTDTGANYRWAWQKDRMLDPASKARPEYQVLMQLFPRYGQGEDEQVIHALSQLAERGVYKALSLWLKDKLKGDQTKSFREYSARKESAEFATLLNIADWASQGVIGSVLAPVAGVPAVAVALGLIVGKYGYQKLVEGREGVDVD